MGSLLNRTKGRSKTATVDLLSYRSLTMDEKSEMVRQRSAQQNMPLVPISFEAAKKLHKKLGRWIWPLGLATAGLAAVTTVLLRGCRHTHLSWPVRHDDHYSYRVCTTCGAKRLFDHNMFREYGPYEYDLNKLIARERSQRMKRMRKAMARAQQRAEHQKKSAS
jgi:hypothetical protein